MTAERWLPVVGWEGFYEVSDEGRIKALPRVTTDGRRTKSRIMRPGSNPQGYRIAVFYRDGRREGATVHATVMAAFVGPRPEGYQIAHGDGDKTNNALSNLRYATQSENEMDKQIHGRNHNRNKTHCSNGHPFTPENTLMKTSRNWRKCRVCNRERMAALRAERRALARERAA